MKTQLLEDIGQSAAISLAPSKLAGNSKTDKALPSLAPAEHAQPAKARAALGVWRQRPAAEPLLSPPPQPEQQQLPQELSEVFEEIAALEALYAPPSRPPEPAITQVEAQHELPPSRAEPPHQPPAPPAEPTLASASSTQSAAAPPDPLFDFTALPAPQGSAPASDPASDSASDSASEPASYSFTRAPTAPARSRQRYLVWAACLLSGALLAQGGYWLYQERNDGRALVAGEAKESPQADTAMQPRAPAAKEPRPKPEGGPRPAPAVPASAPVPLPPLVMLEPEPVAAQKPISSSPPPPARRAREPSDAAAVPTAKRSEREPVRPFARASAMGTASPSGQDTSMEATLKACRERGYHAAQCIKRACGMTKYGFVCRGR